LAGLFLCQAFLFRKTTGFRFGFGLFLGLAFSFRQPFDFTFCRQPGFFKGLRLSLGCLGLA
jgi:hypothetical protein